MSREEQNISVKQKLDEIKEGVDQGEIKDLYQHLYKNEDQPAYQTYDNLGLGFAVQNIVESDLKKKINKVSEDKLVQFKKGLDKNHDKVHEALDFLDK